MLYPKPGTPGRMLPSIYTRLRQAWLRSNGTWVRPSGMNSGHRQNTMNLLKESHGNIVERSTLALGKIAKHFSNQPDIVDKCRDLCLAMQTVDVDDMYPIFKLLAHAELAEVDPSEIDPLEELDFDL